MIHCMLCPNIILSVTGILEAIKLIHWLSDSPHFPLYQLKLYSGYDATDRFRQLDLASNGLGGLDNILVPSLPTDMWILNYRNAVEIISIP